MLYVPVLWAGLWCPGQARLTQHTTFRINRMQKKSFLRAKSELHFFYTVFIHVCIWFDFNYYLYADREKIDREYYLRIHNNQPHNCAAKVYRCLPLTRLGEWKLSSPGCEYSWLTGQADHKLSERRGQAGQSRVRSSESESESVESETGAETELGHHRIQDQDTKRPTKIHYLFNIKSRNFCWILQWDLTNIPCKLYAN